MNAPDANSAIRKSVTVDWAPQEAFERFTRDMNDWWPTATHSVGKHESVQVVFETRQGGRIFERTAEGVESEWGKVLEWEPPTRFVMSWHPGRDADGAQRLEVTFHPEGDGTRLEIVHSGWEKLGDKERIDAAVAGYDEGWDMVLGLYVA